MSLKNKQLEEENYRLKEKIENVARYCMTHRSSMGAAAIQSILIEKDGQDILRESKK